MRRTGLYLAAVAVIVLAFFAAMRLLGNLPSVLTEHGSTTVVSVMPHERSDQQELRVKGDSDTYLCSPTNGSCNDVAPGDRVSFTFWKVDGKLFVVKLKIE